VLIAEAVEGNKVPWFGQIVHYVEHLTYNVKGNPKQEFNLIGAGIGGGFIYT
jgi:hypothetical protein